MMRFFTDNGSSDKSYDRVNIQHNLGVKFSITGAYIQPGGGVGVYQEKLYFQLS